MSQALTQVSAKAPGLQSGDAEDHLHPAYDGEAFTENSVDGDECWANPFLRSPLQMKLKVDAEEGLCCQVEHQKGSKGAVCGVRELSTFVTVAEEIAAYCQQERCGSDGNMESVSDHTKDHGKGEEEEPGKCLDADVDPENGIDGY